MADRVHPRDSPPPTVEAASNPSQEAPLKPAPPMPENPVPPPPGTYVIQVPKDQIYRHPPPENARRYQNYTRRKARRSFCCRCLCWTLGLIALLIVLLAVAAGILYLVFRPKAPKYSVDDVAIRGFNLTSSSTISPEFDVTVRARNPNDKIGIYYQKASSVKVYYSDINLCNGVLPTFYQPSNNVTIFQKALKGSKILLTSAVNSALVAEQKQGKVPLRLNLKAPVKIKVGAVKTWTITVKVKCDVTVDKLTAQSKIVDKDCDYCVKLW
uniref:Late embryogenesis abundant protein LEA-2 subgroup domain-containing protein n=1 Tax=Davidia involucrata TaxID=16924 RepID=A0A5B7ABP5_DAVIN